MKIVVSTLCILCVHLVKSDLVYEYYEKLITDRVANAQTFQLPENNAEFAEGAATEEPYHLGTYDFIIVGAGSAGSVLATRLSEIRNWNILLLEAGNEENDFSSIPAFFSYLQFSEMNWGYYSTPQSTCCLGMKDKKCIVPRGKTLGGSSAINAVMYVRGNPQDYDRWVELGNLGWSYEEVLPYFIKSENSQINGDDNYHGKSGFWNVEYALPTLDQLYRMLSNGIGELNGTQVDYNGQQQFGVSQTQLNIKHGKRQSTATAFLDNAQKRSNLDILPGSLVTKISIDPETKAAQGVEFVTLNTKFSATATKEVIVSGGAINSPQLLMLSGIGPKDHLTELGINVIEDLPVGKNLRDHPLFLGLTIKSNYTVSHDDAESLISDYLYGFGQYTTPGILGLGFIPGKTSYPMVEYLFVPPGGSSAAISHRAFNFDEELVSNYLQKINTTSDIMIPLVLLHPKSNGQITLKSKDPIDFPNIDLNMFSESVDVENLIEGIEYILKLSQTEAFKELDATLMDIPICTDLEQFSREFWECAIRHMTATLYHPIGTTAMGSDKTSSVVDNNLKVHGIKNLRVVDAGVFPSTTSGHTNAPTVMVAEKISDVIKNEYQT